MFLRGSAIFCTSEDVKRILADKVKTLDLLIAAESDVSFTYYDDDGHTEDYRRGHYSETKISVKAGDRTRIRFEKSGDYADSVERLTIRLVSKKKGAFWVTVDGEQIPRYLVRDVWETSESGWYYELSDRSILVKTPKPKKDSFEIVISTEKFDLIGMADE
jgi:alpha-glucosidase